MQFNIQYGFDLPVIREKCTSLTHRSFVEWINDKMLRDSVVKIAHIKLILDNWTLLIVKEKAKSKMINAHMTVT